MKEEDKILERIGKPEFKVPEGYFDSLKSRLGQIPSNEQPSSDAIRTGRWSRITPYAALAACFLAMVILGNAVLRNTAGRDSLKATAVQSDTSVLSDGQEYEIYADLAPVMQNEALFNFISSEEQGESISDEEIINHLIESGASAEHIEYLSR